MTRRPWFVLLVVAGTVAGGLSPARAATWQRLTAPAQYVATQVAMSGSGRVVVWLASMPDDSGQLYAYDRTSRRTELVTASTTGTPSDGFSYNPVVSNDGRYVAFISNAPGLVRGDTNGRNDVFVRDRLRRLTTRVGVDTRGGELPRGATAVTISADGSTVAYAACTSFTACNLVVSRWQWRSAVVIPGVEPGPYSLSANGRRVVFPAVGRFLPDDVRSGAGCAPDLYLRDLVTRRTTLLTGDVTPRAGDCAGTAQVHSESYLHPAIDPDGTCVAFESFSSTGLQRVWLRDLESGALTDVSRGAAGVESGWPAVTRRCGAVFFQVGTMGFDLPTGGVYRYTRATGGLDRVWADLTSPAPVPPTPCPELTCALFGDPTDGLAPRTYGFAISSDGGAFAVVATQSLDPADTNALPDCYLRI